MRNLAISIFIFFLGSGISQAQDIPREDEVIASTSDLTDFLNSGPLRYRIETYHGLEELDEGRADRAYTIFIEQGLAGDLNALALATLLCKADEANPSRVIQRVDRYTGASSTSICPVQAQFWEDSLISLLGEGEGNFILGLFGMELIDDAPLKYMKIFTPMVEDYMLRSARTGHSHGMSGAFLTSENRGNQVFTPPKNLPNIPIFPEKYDPDMHFESRFWLTHAAHGGNMKAMGLLARIFRGDYATIEADKEQMKYYSEMAIAHGSDACAVLLAAQYVRGHIIPQSCYNAVYYYSIAAQLEQVLRNSPGIYEEYLVGEKSLIALKSGVIDDGFVSVNREIITTGICLTEVEYEQAVAESKLAYEAIKATQDAERAAHDALYDAARARLPEVRAAYEQALRENAGGR